MSIAERVERHLGLQTAELPRGLPWLYAAGAILGAPVFSRNMFVLPAHQMFEAFVGNALPFIVVPGAGHAVYRFVMPGLLRCTSSPTQRVLAHAGMSTAAAAIAGVLLWSVIGLIGWRRAPLSGVIATDVVMTWAFLFPSKLVLAWKQVSARNELYAIQSRAHPHFLFNAINTVASLIPEDPERAEETLVRFAEVLRYILETSTVPSIPLARDLAMLREYLDIQRVRFERLHYSIEVEAGLDAVKMPPLLLLPLVENAVMHGVAATGAGKVSVRIHQDDDGLAFDVEDEGPGSGASPRQGNGIALRDLRRRLELLYGGAASIVSGAKVGGNIVKLHVPLEARV